MEFEITFDYLCPFARNANEAVLNGLEEGRDWDVRFRPFSLSQVHVGEGEPEVFEDRDASGVLALQWGIAARENDPDSFPAAHRALFAARHDRGEDIRDEAVLKAALEEAGVDVGPIVEAVASGAPARTLAEEHTEAVESWRVFGVPTFIRNDVGTFVRLMSRGAVEDVDRTLDLLSWQEMNEFKRTRIPR
ncbi:MAG: DsbA family protein [Actinomycetota bacterium]